MSKLISRTDPLADFKKQIKDEMEMHLDQLTERVSTYLEESLELEFDGVNEQLEILQEDVKQLKAVNQALITENIKLRSQLPD